MLCSWFTMSVVLTMHVGRKCVSTLLECGTCDVMVICVTGLFESMCDGHLLGSQCGIIRDRDTAGPVSWCSRMEYGIQKTPLLP
jgi:hypothetical protein